MRSFEQIPSSLYRIQVSESFPLKKAIALLPYLEELGVDGVYLPPIFACVSSGYDVTDPNRLNPAIGRMEDWEAFCGELRKRGMQLMLDIVPNHMGIERGNAWWDDVMEKGAASPYAGYFDIDWNGKVVLPILGEDSDLELIWKEGFKFRIDGYEVPLALHTYGPILESRALAPVPREHRKEWAECLAAAKAGQKERVVDYVNRSEFIRARIDEIAALWNGETLDAQFYRFTDWRNAGREINYRRFFNINELAAICIEKKEVLEAHHRWVFEMVQSGQVQGLRVDHPDGFFDPTQYFERVREKGPAFVLAEKVLDYGESLPEKWDVDGTVGYEYINILDGLFVCRKNEKKFAKIYEKFIGQKLDFHQVLYERRKRYIADEMESEVRRLARMSDRTLIRAIEETLACYPVYRTYIKPGAPVRKKDRDVLLKAIEQAKKKAPAVRTFDDLKQRLLLKKPGSAEFAQRFQQVTAPLMAKGLEDSTFYIYNRLISLNEVGGNPSLFGHTAEEFHRFNREKREKWPLGLLASSTHDTKYSEDVRLRIHILSEMPDEWQKHVEKWKTLNEKYKTKIDGALFPDLNTEYYLYQLLVGVWRDTEFDERLRDTVLKIVREAGVHTSWRKPNERYETAVLQFLDAILKCGSIRSFQKKLSLSGNWNSLSATTLKMGSCGIAEIYQGSEMWKYSMVDPDNRRPVDFVELKKNLRKKKPPIKMAIVQRALQFRREHKELFLSGEYLPLVCDSEHVVAFARRHGDQIAIVAGGRFFFGKKGWKGAEIQLPKEWKKQKWQNIYTGQTLQGDVLRLSDLFRDLPCAILTN